MFMLSPVEHDNFFVTSGPDQSLSCLYKGLGLLIEKTNALHMPRCWATLRRQHN